MTPVGRILMSLMDDVGSDLTLPELLCRSAKRELDAVAVGLAVMTADATSELVAASDPAARELELLQLTLGEGPCLEAHRTGRLVQLAELGSGAQRWPAYSAHLVERGVAAVSAFPLRIGGIRLGALDVYRARAGTLSDDDLSLALHFVDAAVVVLLHLQDPASQRPLDDPRLGETVDDGFTVHPEVHQATGMVSVQAVVSLRDALLLLRAHAFVADRSIIEVARDVVARRIDFR